MRGQRADAEEQAQNAKFRVKKMLHIKVPATTANMGPGFDCIGMALKLYNNLWVSVNDAPGAKPVEIEVKSQHDITIPTDESNFIYVSIRRFYEEMGINKEIPPIKMIQEDSIPLTRGLGSSAACIVAGLLAANELSGAGLSRDELINLAAKIEGHPDNSTPAFTGGLIAGAMTDGVLDYVKIVPHESLRFAVMIPDFPLSTEKARGVLPKVVPMADAVYNASRTALLVYAYMTGERAKLRTAVSDRLHEPFRMPIVPDMRGIFEQSRKLSAHGVFLSGAGPTIIAVTTDDGFVGRMGEYLQTLPNKWRIQYIEPDLTGATLEILNGDEKS